MFAYLYPSHPLGSLDAETGIYAAAFDLSGRYVTASILFITIFYLFAFLELLNGFSRLITCEADKSIKIWKENSTADENSHPIDVNGWSKQYLALKRF